MDPYTTLRTAGMLGICSSFYLSGVYFSSSQIMLPIVYNHPTKTGTSVFKDIYYNGIVVVLPLTVVASVCFATAAYLVEPTTVVAAAVSDAHPNRVAYVVASVAAISPGIFTRLFMAGGIETLLKCEADDQVREKVGDQKIMGLFRTWRKQNYGRSLLALAAGIAGLMGFFA